jgi:mRNA interferase YafQ
MRTIQPVKAYKRDYRRVKSNPRHRNIDERLIPFLEVLAEDTPLPASNRDHTLSGNWVDCRECHIKPDLLLIYRKPDADTLQLLRLGSHSDLFR